MSLGLPWDECYLHCVCHPQVNQTLKTELSAPLLVDVLGCPKNVMDVEPRRMSRADLHLMFHVNETDVCRLGSVDIRAFVGRFHASGSSRTANLTRACFLPTATRTLFNTIRSPINSIAEH